MCIAGVISLVKLHKSVTLASSPLELNVSVSDGVHMSHCIVAVDLLPADTLPPPTFPADYYEVTICVTVDH